jgi:hypothetical protein
LPVAVRWRLTSSIAGQLGDADGWCSHHNETTKTIDMLPDKIHCCDAMTAQLTHRCEVHVDPADCPDVLVSYEERFDSYGLWIHDGGASVVAIAHCPWCGTALPSRSEEWFDQLERLGFDEPFTQDIPAEFRSAAWYRDA